MAMRPSHPHKNSSLFNHVFDVTNVMHQRAKSSFAEEHHELAEFVCRLAGLCHDIFKDTEAFENSLYSSSGKRNKSSRHSGGSALFAFCVTKQVLDNRQDLLEGNHLRPYIPALVFSIIAAHHDKIKQIDIAKEHSEALAHWLETRSDASWKIIEKLESDFEIKINLKEIDKIMREVSERKYHYWPDFRKAGGDLTFDLLLLNRIFLGALSVADSKSAFCETMGEKLEIEDFIPETARIMSPKGLSGGEGLNYLRSSFQEAVCKNSSAEGGAYIIKAPTGLGKTFAAAKIIDKIQQAEGACKVFYLAPTVTILRQVYDEFKSLVSEGELLEVHYMAEDEKYLDESLSKDELFRRELKRNMWDSGMIITTYHRLISLLSGMNKADCQNLYALHKAIFILDESQFISHIQYPAFISLISSLVKFSASRVFFMSATPQDEVMWEKGHISLHWGKIDDLKPLLEKKDERRLETDVLINGRRNIYPCPEISLLENLKSAVQEYRDKNPQKSILILLNLAKDARRLYELLEEDGNPPDYLITSYLRPKDVKNNLVNAKEELKARSKVSSDNNFRPIIMVATSIVQAGVDLDFDAGFIELNDLATFRQGCGRVGRMFDENRGPCDVFCFEILDDEVKRRPSWFRQRFGTKDDISNEKKIFRDVVQKSIRRVLEDENKCFSDLDIEAIEKESAKDIFQIYDETRKKILHTFPPSYKNILGLPESRFTGFDFDRIHDVLTDPLNEQDSACPYLVLFLKDEYEEYCKVNNLCSDLTCLEKQILMHDDNFFDLLKEHRRKKKQIQRVVAPFSLRRFDILKSFENKITKKIQLMDFYLYYCDKAQYDEKKKGWEFNPETSESPGVNW